MNFGGMIDGIIFICGIYMLYSAYLMKTKGELKAGILVSKNVNLERSKDLPGYIQYMYPRSIIFAVGILIYSTVALYSAYVTDLGTIPIITSGIFIVVVVWFGVVSMRANKKFLA